MRMERYEFFILLVTLAEVIGLTIIGVSALLLLLYVTGVFT